MSLRSRGNLTGSVVSAYVQSLPKTQASSESHPLADAVENACPIPQHIDDSSCPNNEPNVGLPNFDAEFYASLYPDLQHLTKGELKVHWLNHGRNEGRFSDLSAWLADQRTLDIPDEFSLYLYKMFNKDLSSVLKRDVDFVLHFANKGRFQGRRFSVDIDTVGAAFDRDFYLSAHPELVGDCVDPVRHYVTIGAKLGWDPSPEFSTTFYIKRSPDVRKAGVNPFYHYLVWGRLEGRIPTQTALDSGVELFDSKAELLKPSFDSGYYLSRNPELASYNVDPLLHYLHFGWQKGLDPNANFSTQFYLDNNHDVRNSGENPFYHYLRIGRVEGRLPKKSDTLLQLDAEPECEMSHDYLEGRSVKKALENVFDERFYLERYPDISAGKLDPLEHYLVAGWAEGRDPAPWFSTRFYIDRYPGVVATCMNPLFHYVVWGKAQNFSTYRGDRRETKAKLVPGVNLVTTKGLGVLRHRNRDASRQTGFAEDPSCMDIHWIIPDFDVGGGGHMTIFRMVKWLEFFGHRCTVWVNWQNFDRDDAEREELLLKHYQVLRASVRTLSSSQSFEGVDALIATSWDTAYIVSDAKGPKKKFYFVQDFEPFFNPVGAHSLAAELTYGFGMACICASPWLERLMRERGSQAHSFLLAADECYGPPKLRGSNAPLRIAVYARTHTARRATELALLALEVLAEQGEVFHVDFFGTDQTFDETPFSATNWGIVDGPTLAKLYGEADIGVCFSATNYSLVPQEMMACGLPVVELDTESTREAYPDRVVLMAKPDPYVIAEKLALLLHDASERRALAERGANWVRTLSWENAARDVEKILHSYLRNGGTLPALSGWASNKVTASVVIPTRNGGVLFRQVLDAVRRQRTPWPFEIIIIDTESSDDTGLHAATLGDPCIRVVTIRKSDFQHGRTRNFGASLARGDYVAFLTQDALPADEFWLYNIVLMLERFPKAAGVFGRHLAWPDASPYTKRDIATHFRLFDNQSLCVSKYSDISRWNSNESEFRRFLHYYSDNNSCLRRSVWQRLPLPEVDYGEDQLWADHVIKEGYAKVYAPKAVVYHSHEYDETLTFERARTESKFFLTYFGYDLTPSDWRNDSRQLNIEDELWGVQNGVSAEDIAERRRLNVLRLAGLATGTVEGVDFASRF